MLPGAGTRETLAGYATCSSNMPCTSRACSYLQALSIHPSTEHVEPAGETKFYVSVTLVDLPLESKVRKSVCYSFFVNSQRAATAFQFGNYQTQGTCGRLAPGRMASFVCLLSSSVYFLCPQWEWVRGAHTKSFKLSLLWVHLKRQAEEFVPTFFPRQKRNLLSRVGKYKYR